MENKDVGKYPDINPPPSLARERIGVKVVVEGKGKMQALLSGYLVGGRR